MGRSRFRIEGKLNALVWVSFGLGYELPPPGKALELILRSLPTLPGPVTCRASRIAPNRAASRASATTAASGPTSPMQGRPCRRVARIDQRPAFSGT